MESMEALEIRLKTPQAIGRALEKSFDRLCATLELLDEDERDAPGLDGGWSPKVELAHVAFWDAFQTGRMEAALAGRSVEGYPRPDHDNDARAQQDAQRDWDEVLATAKASRRCLIDFTVGLDPEVLARNFPEGEQRFSIGRQARHMVRHTLMHEQPIRRFCGSMQRWDRSRLRAFLAAQHAHLLAGVEQLPEATVLSTPVCGRWTPRDVLVHVLSWNEHADRLLAGWPAPDPGAISAWPLDMHMDALNDQLMAARSHMGVDDAIEGLKRYHGRLLDIFDRASDAELSGVGQTWFGEEALSRQFFEVAVHEAEHAADIWRLRD